jgi:hypothetical protein
MKKIFVLFALFSLVVSACMGPPKNPRMQLIHKRGRVGQKLAKLADCIDWVRIDLEEDGKAELPELVKFHDNAKACLEDYDLHGGFINSMYCESLLDGFSQAVGILEEIDEPVLASLAEHVQEKLEDVY